MHCGGRTAALAVSVGILIGRPAFAVDYHVDCRAGNDDHDGRTPDTAWLSLTKASATTFSPGDSILLKRETRCPGTLWP